MGGANGTGTDEFTRMRCGATSWAMLFIINITPPFSRRIDVTRHGITSWTLLIADDFAGGTTDFLRRERHDA